MNGGSFVKKGLLIVVSGASGTGKGTVLNALLEKNADISYSVSATTRKPRPGEKNGVNYHFMTREEFEGLIEKDGFLEWAKVYDNYYGTPLAKIEEKRAAGVDVLLEIDTQGALKVMDKCPDGVFVFLLPPSMEELKRRIKGRGTENEDELNKRLASAAQEIAVGKKYRYAVVNDEVEKAVLRLEAIITAEHCKISERDKEEIFAEYEV